MGLLRLCSPQKKGIPFRERFLCSSPIFEDALLKDFYGLLCKAASVTVLGIQEMGPAGRRSSPPLSPELPGNPSTFINGTVDGGTFSQSSRTPQLKKNWPS